MLMNKGGKLIAAPNLAAASICQDIVCHSDLAK
jgi:hypothetical protein